MIEEAPVEIRIFAERDSEMGLFFMHKKGGYMGGRGSNSNLGGGSGSGLKTTGLDVTHNGETTRYYFTSKDGQNYYQRGISGTPEPTPLNMSAKEFRQRVESNGAKTKAVSNAEYKKDTKRQENYRKAADRALNSLEYNETAKKSTRQNRLMDRAMRKKY